MYDASRDNIPRQPVLFVSHGAAVFTMSPAEPTNRFLASLEALVAERRPAGIVMISAHWAAAPVRVTADGALTTLHDHPLRALKDYAYPGRGSKQLTREVQRVLAAAGVTSEIDEQRGLDHGAWVPLSLLCPRGDLPVLQLSLDARELPAAHVKLGEALAPLREAGVLLIGSGGVTHNQAVFRDGYFSGANPSAPAPFSRDFDSWVSTVIESTTGIERYTRLCAFAEHPSGAQAHPTIEHFLPLLVAVGAAGVDAGRKLFEGFQHSLSTSAFQFA